MNNNDPDKTDIDILKKAKLWIENDPCAQTRLEMRKLLEANNRQELEDRLSKTLEFGTAGLRALQGAGSNRINTVVAARAANALCQFLLEENRGKVIVVGYDGRYNSQLWARNTARIASGYGLLALLMPRALPTPLLAFAVRHLDAAAGVMVTASHNPRDYNGYKVYLGGRDEGAQIADADATIIAQKLKDEIPYSAIPMRDAYGVLDEQVVESYISLTAKEILREFDAPGGELRICHTAMHGVGHEVFVRLMRRLGFHDLVHVEEQKWPDPAFPTLPFPNPEERGALDLAFETARAASCDIILANDPDADRLAVACGGGRVFTGNEIGLVLGCEIARMRAGHRVGSEATQVVLSNSMVSSPIMRQVAEVYGAHHAETPTGFKWVTRVPNISFGFEEALGYMIHPGIVRDKDGLSAGAAVAMIAARQKAVGRNLEDYINDLKDQFGYFSSGQHAVRVASFCEMRYVMQRLRSAPLDRIEEFRVTKYRDLSGESPPVDLLKLDLEGDSGGQSRGRLIIRPSGTELKLKCYIDSLAQTAEEAEKMLLRITRACKNLIANCVKRGSA